MRPTSALILWLIGLPFQGPPATAAETSFLPLFNGRDLSGWTNVNCAPETWTVTNGWIHCTGRPTGALRTLRQYENFILELEWRHLRNAGNAGVFIWAEAISAPGVPFLRAIEVQVLDHGYGQTDSYTTHGDVFPIHGSTMKPHGRSRGMRSFPSELRSKPSPEWNHYRIVATHGVLRLSVNGQEVSGGSDCIYRKGYIALESEGSPVQFRNLRLQELPPGDLPPDQSAPADTGWISIYNGLDLREWSAGPAAPAGPATPPAATRTPGFQANDWQLALTQTASTPQPAIWRPAPSTAFEWILDFQLPKDAALDQPWLDLLLSDNPRQPLVRVGGDGGTHTLTDRRWADGNWHRLRLRIDARSATVSCAVDNARTEVQPLPMTLDPRAFLGIRHANRALRLASLYVRPIP